MRLLLLFAVPFAGLTALDIATSRLAIHHRGFQEINAYTDPTSVGSMVAPEIATFALCAVFIFLGVRWKGKELRLHADTGFSHFVNFALQPKTVLGALFIVVPILLAVGRVLPVISNVLLLTAGRTPFDSLRNGLSSLLGLNRGSAQVAMIGILFTLLLWPVLYFVFRAIRTAPTNGAEPRDSRDRHPGAGQGITTGFGSGFPRRDR